MTDAIPLDLTPKKRKERVTEQVWMVKYALTEGPQLVDAVIENGCAHVYPKGEDGKPEFYRIPIFLHVESRDWCRTKEEALKACEIMRRNKLESMERRMDKLVNLNFKKLLGID